MKPAPSEHPENTQAAPTDTQNTQDHVDSGSVKKLPDRPDRPSPFYVGWKVDGVRKKMGFKNAKDRDEKFRELEKAAKRGTLDLVPTRDDLRDWQAFKRATHPTRWQDVVAGWRESGQFSCTTTVAAAVDAFITGREKRVKEGTINESTVAHQRTDMRRFKDSFGSMRLDEPTAEQIEEWLDDLGSNSNATFNSKLKVVRSFFNGAVEQGLVRASPAASILLRDGSIGEVGINTVAEMAQLFSYAKEHHPESLGRLALEAFAGLRFSSSYRLEKHDINFADKGILLPRNKLKTKRRRYIDKLPENLWTWLAATNDACWAMQENEWMHLKSDIFREAKVPHPHNSLRHSFATHHVAWLKDAGRTATILCHTNQEELWEHYNGCATKQAGKLYFTITPLSAVAMAKDPQILGLTYPRPAQKTSAVDS